MSTDAPMNLAQVAEELKDVPPATVFSCDLCTCLSHVSHMPKKKRYKVTMEVPEGIGARIMEYAAMVGGLTPWEDAKLLDGGLRLTERGEKRHERLPE